MTQRMTSWIAWSLWLLTVAVTAFIWWVTLLTEPASLDPVFDLAFLGFATVGALVVSYQPHHRLGWIYLGGPFLNVAGFGLANFVWYTHTIQPTVLVGADWLLWVGNVIDTLGISLVFRSFLLFPTGRLPSRRWRPLGWFVVATMTLGLVHLALAPGPIYFDVPSLHNPLGMEKAARFFDTSQGIVDVGNLCAILASVGAVILRFHRAVTLERQQIKWLAYAASVFLVLFSLYVVASFFVSPTVKAILRHFLAAPGVALLPLAIGIAILKYHLFAIDLIIRRTLIYGMLTGLLALIYFGSVALLQQLFRAFSGQDSQLAIVVSTLVLAALFQPLRRRVQNSIDRHFYRRKYNAEQILTAFSARVRNETDVEQLTGRLLGVLAETLQPTQVSLWLPKPVQKPSPAFTPLQPR